MLGLLFVTNRTDAQITVNVTPSTQTVNNGDNVVVDVDYSGFTNMVSMEFKITYDPTVLQFNSLTDVTDQITGFSAASSVGTPPTIAAGLITVSWFDFAVSGVTAPDDLLFRLNFTAIGADGASSDLSIIDREASDGDGNLIPLNFTNGEVVISGGGGGGTNPNNPLTTSIESATVGTGSQVCLDFTVEDFLELESMQYSIHWDSTVLQFQSVSNTNLTDFSTSSYANISSGTLLISWNSDVLANPMGVTTPDGSVIFELCFNAIGAGGTSSNVYIDSTPTPIEVTNITSGNNLGMVNTPGVVTISGSTGSALTVSMGSSTGTPGQTVCLDVSVDNFNDIVSLEYTTVYDPSIMLFNSIQSINPALPGLSTAAFGTPPAVAEGAITFSWFDPSTNGVTLANGDVMYQICFDIVGSAPGGTVTDVTINPTEATQDDNGATVLVPLVAQNGTVTVSGTSTDGFAIFAGDETGNVGDTVCIDYTVQDFNDILGIQYIMGYDPAVLEFVEVTNPGLPFLSPAGSFNLFAPGDLRLLWFDQNVSGVTIPNGDPAPIYTVCFKVLAGCGTTTPITFTEAPPTLILEITDINGEVDPFTLVPGSVTVDCGGMVPAITVGNTNTTNVECNGESTGAIDITVSGGTGTYTYSWSNSATTEDLTNIPAGTYSVTVTSGSQMEIIDNIVITQPAAPLAITGSTPTGVDCNGASTGEISLTITGGTSPYNVSWTGGLSGQTITGLAAGSYTPTVTDANNCELIGSAVIITQPAAPLAITGSTPTDVDCNGASTGEISLTITGGTSPYNVSWTGGLSGQTITGLAAGSYTPTVTDANNCELVGSAIVIAQPSATMSITGTTPTDITCNGASTGSISISITGGATPYMVDWTGGLTGQTITGLAAGSYTPTITDANGCTLTGSAVMLTEPALALAIDGGTTTVTDVACSGTPSGAITLGITGGTSPYSVSWTGGLTGQTITGLAGGTYTPTVMDSNGCSLTGTPVTVGQPAGVLAIDNANAVNISCNGLTDGSITLTIVGGTAPYSVNWSNGMTGTTLTGLGAGSLTPTITDDNGCTLTGTPIPISEPDAISITGNITNANANDGAIDVTTTGGTIPYNYNWSNGLGTNEDVSGLAAGSYTVTVTDGANCTASQMFTINQNNNINLTANDIVVTNVDCNGGTTGAINISPSGNVGTFSFSWSNSFTTEDLSGLAAGTYTVTLTDSANGNMLISQPIVVTEPSAIGSTTGNITAVTCAGAADGTAGINITGGTAPYSVNWGGGISGNPATGLSGGTYTPTITDDNGCQAVAAAVTINEAATALSIDGADVTDVGCDGGNTGAITLNISGGATPYTITWNNGFTGPTINNLISSDYIPTVVDANGCEVVGNIVFVDQITALTVTSNITAETQAGNDGAIDITPTGGDGVYSYSWDPNGETTQDLSGLTSGTYTVTVMDGTGCSSVEVFTLAPGASISTSSTTDVTCNGGNDGAIDITVTGGQIPYSFEWSANAGGATTEDVSGLSAGTYTVTITDNSGGVFISQPFNIDEPLDAISIASPNINCETAAGSDGAINITVSGGDPAYVYQWSNNFTGEDPSGLTAGFYTVTITDSNSCEFISNPIEVCLNAAVIIVSDSNVDDVSCFGALDGSINITAAGGATPYTYLWSANAGSATTEDVNGLAAGSYSVTITDANGIEGTETFEIIQPSAITLTLDDVVDETCPGGNGAVYITIDGGMAPYNYEWNIPNDSQDLVNVESGIYMVTVTDANGCILQSANYEIANETPCFDDNATVINDVLCNGDATGAIDLVVFGGEGTYTYNWEGPGGFTGDTPNINTLLAGTYNVTITDGDGGVSTASYDIGEPTTVSVAATLSPATNGNDGAIDLSVTGGTPGYTFSWTGPGLPNGTSSEDLSNIGAGLYEVVVTDINGCQQIESFTIMGQVAVSSVITNADCDGALGAIDITVNGIPPFTYDWQGPNGFSNSNEDITGLEPGDYTLTFIDGTGIPVTEVYTVGIDSPIQLILSSTGTSIAGASDGTATVVINGGTPDYTIEWSNGGTTSTISELMSGTYTITVTDADGCMQIGKVIVPGGGGIAVAVNVVSTATCNNECDAELQATVAGGVGPYTYQWDDPAAQQSNFAFGLCGGQTVSVTVTDSEGMQGTASAFIPATPELAVAFNAVSATGYGNADGNIEAMPIGGTAPYLFQWNTDNNDTTRVIENLLPGEYAVVVIDANGCQALSTFDLGVDDGECRDARTIISPNDDGLNDEFVIGCAIIYDNTLEIYNRWGQQVHTATNYDNSWRGTDENGDLLPEGGYFYVFEYTVNDEVRQLKGAITIIRQ